jgi:hypothetical protein
MKKTLRCLCVLCASAVKKHFRRSLNCYPKFETCPEFYFLLFILHPSLHCPLTAALTCPVLAIAYGICLMGPTIAASQ